MVCAVEKSICDADLGLNTCTHGDLIRVAMPSLTEDSRRNLLKVVGVKGEEARVTVRNIRRDAKEALKEMLRTNIVSEDVLRHVNNELQGLIDKYIGKIDKIISEKSTGILPSFTGKKRNI